MIWQETWIHLHAYRFGTKRGATYAGGLISLLIELSHIMRTVRMGFGAGLRQMS